MSIIISSASKGEIIDTFQRLLWMTMYPRAPTDEVAQMQELFEHIKRSKANLDVGAKLQSNPVTQEVVLTFNLRLGR